MCVPLSTPSGRSVLTLYARQPWRFLRHQGNNRCALTRLFFDGDGLLDFVEIRVGAERTEKELTIMNSQNRGGMFAMNRGVAPPHDAAPEFCMRQPHPFPEIYFDGNARMTERGYALVRGSLEDLAKLGLSPANAVGMRFTFVMHDDDDLMFNGIVVHDPKWGYLAYADEDGLYMRSEIETFGQ